MKGLVKMTSTTLRDLGQADNTPARLGSSTLIMIDFQNTYRTGVMELEGAEAGVAAGARLLERARNAGSRIIHVRHDAGPDSPYDLTAPIGQISDEVAPIDGESIVTKQYPNSFHQTDLLSLLEGAGAGDDLVLAGFMAHMCLRSTAEGAFNLGYRPTVVADATATRSLTSPGGGIIGAAQLREASLTTITDVFGTVVGSSDDLTT